MKNIFKNRLNLFQLIGWNVLYILAVYGLFNYSS